ncbi:MAG: Lpg1974 family pore-forming outer membrane protein [Xanthobacteraceae bacterium]
MAERTRPTDLVGLRGALLVGVSLGALSIGFGGMSNADAANLKIPAAAKVKVLKAPPPPPPPAWFFSAEGGAACSSSNIAVRSPFVPGADLAHVGSACGWTTRLGFGQEHSALFGGIADYWGIFVRYTRIQDSTPVNGQFNVLFPAFPNLYPYGFSANTGFEEHRTVIDFEAGRDIGIGDGSKVRAIAGLRFAHYSGETNVLGSAGGYAANFFTQQRFNGFGPRIGLSYRRPLVGMLELAAEGSASGLWGRYKTNIADTFNGSGAYSITGGESHDGWVGNLEGSIAVAYAPYGPRGWEASLGIRGEAWFNQIDINTFSASSSAPRSAFTGTALVTGQREDRFNWGPFLRFKVPLGN